MRFSILGLLLYLCALMGFPVSAMAGNAVLPFDVDLKVHGIIKGRYGDLFARIDTRSVAYAHDDVMRIKFRYDQLFGEVLEHITIRSPVPSKIEVEKIREDANGDAESYDKILIFFDDRGNIDFRRAGTYWEINAPTSLLKYFKLTQARILVGFKITETSVGRTLCDGECARTVQYKGIFGSAGEWSWDFPGSPKWGDFINGVHDPHQACPVSFDYSVGGKVHLKALSGGEAYGKAVKELFLGAGEFKRNVQVKAAVCDDPLGHARNVYEYDERFSMGYAYGITPSHLAFDLGLIVGALIDAKPALAKVFYEKDLKGRTQALASVLTYRQEKGESSKQLRDLGARLADAGEDLLHEDQKSSLAAASANRRGMLSSLRDSLDRIKELPAKEIPSAARKILKAHKNPFSNAQNGPQMREKLRRLAAIAPPFQENQFVIKDNRLLNSQGVELTQFKKRFNVSLPIGYGLAVIKNEETYDFYSDYGLVQTLHKDRFFREAIKSQIGYAETNFEPRYVLGSMLAFCGNSGNALCLMDVDFNIIQKINSPTIKKHHIHAFSHSGDKIMMKTFDDVYPVRKVKYVYIYGDGKEVFASSPRGFFQDFLKNHEILPFPQNRSGDACDFGLFGSDLLIISCYSSPMIGSAVALMRFGGRVDCCYVYSRSPYQWVNRDRVVFFNKIVKYDQIDRKNTVQFIQRYAK